MYGSRFRWRKNVEDRDGILAISAVKATEDSTGWVFFEATVGASPVVQAIWFAFVGSGKRKAGGDGAW